MLRNRGWLRATLVWLVVLLAIILAVVFFFRTPSNTQQVTVSKMLADVKADIQHGQTDTLLVGSDTLTLTRGKNPVKEIATINDSFDATTVLKDNGINYTDSHLVLQYEQSSSVCTWLNSVGDLVFFLLGAGLVVVVIRQGRGRDNGARSGGKGRAGMLVGNKAGVGWAD